MWGRATVVMGAAWSDGSLKHKGHSMKGYRKKLLAALLLLVAFAVVVVADGTTQAKENQLAAYQKDTENTESKLKAASLLSSKSKPTVKEDKKPAAKKAQAKPAPAAEAKPKPAPASKYPGLDAQTAKYVGECDYRIELYTESAAKAREDGDESLAQLYLAAAAKERAKRDAVIKPDPGKEENLAVQEAAKAESAAFTVIVDNTDKEQLTAEDKQYLRQEVITPLQASTIFFENLINHALKPLLQQLLGDPIAIVNTAASIHSLATGGGCAHSPASAVSTGVAVASFVIPLIRSLIDLVQYLNQDTQQTVTRLNYLVI